MAELRKKGYVAIFLLAAVAAYLLLNMDVTIRQCIDGRSRLIHMPLYVKWTQYMARHYEYARIASEITKNCRTDEEKAVAILAWTRDNISDLQPGMHVYDDHILNVIIRGYGIPVQFQDVFTALCSYAGVPAYWDKVYDKTRKVRYVISFVKIGGKWRVFDAYRGLFFRTGNGDIAAVDDLVNDRSLLGSAADAITVEGVPYKEFYYNLKPAGKPATSRAEMQMPLHRVFFETMKALGWRRGGGAKETQSLTSSEGICNNNT